MLSRIPTPTNTEAPAISRGLFPRSLGTGPIFREMDRQFDRLFHELAGTAGSVPALPMNMWHDDENIFAELELPGVAPEQLEVLAEPESLTVRVERTIERNEGAEVLRSERFAGRSERTVQLPVHIDPEHVTADLRHGVLRITLPKAEGARARKVQVTTG